MDGNRILKQIETKGIHWNGKTLKVLKSLGEGGNGAALLCRTEDGKELVAKIYLPPDKRDLDERALSRFESEVKLTSRINHPNVVRALDSGNLTLGAYSLPFYLMARGLAHPYVIRFSASPRPRLPHPCVLCKGGYSECIPVGFLS